jgi:hypothetical protein
MEAEHVPDGPEYDPAVEADDDARDAIVGAQYADDDRFFADPAHITNWRKVTCRRKRRPWRS